MQTVRLILKLHRFEVAVLAIALLLLAIGASFVGDRVRELAAQFASCHDPLNCTNVGESLARLKLQAVAFPVLGVVVPIFAAVILGVPIVAREIERGTASLPWTMSPSRQSWFIRRVVVLGSVLAAISVPPALALDQLSGAMHPDLDLSKSFQDVDVRGPIIVARAVAALGLASLAGALMGRVLPAILLALCACAAVFFVLQFADDAWLRLDAAPLPASASLENAFVVEVGYQLPDGRIVDWSAAWAALDDPGKNPSEAFPQRYIGVPGDLAPEKRTREVGLISLSGLAAVAAATLIVNRRRPY